MTHRFATITGSVLLAGAVMLGARVAAAHCGDDCKAPLPYAIGPTSTLLAADGVLAFVIPYGRAAMALEFITVSVRDEAEVVVEGTLELNEAFSAVIWRPAVPWSVGGRYTLVTYLDTAALASKAYGAPPGACHTYEHETELTIDAQVLPAPAAPPVSVETEYKVSEDRSLEALVCCDGAMPYLSYGPGSCPSLQVYDGSPCARLRERGSLVVRAGLDLSGLSTVAAGNFVTHLVSADGVPYFRSSVELFAPACLRLESLDLARGEVFVDERCHGEDIANQLGDLAIDPSPVLAQKCEGQPYVCEASYYGWNRERCKTWPDGEDFEVPLLGAMEPEVGEAGGCGCVAGRGAPLGSLLGLALLALPRRRRPGSP